MIHIKSIIRYALICAVLSFCMIILINCDGEIGMEVPDNYRVVCTVEAWDCDKTNKPITVTLGKYNMGIFPQTKNYKIQKNLWMNKLYPYQVYHDQPVFIHDIGYDTLKGADWIMTGFKDWNLKDNNFLRIHMNPIGNVNDYYIAYDGRAKTVPSWLSDPKKYEKVVDQITEKDVYLTLTMLDKSGSGGKFVKMTLWKGLKKTTPLPIQANNSGGADLSGIPNNNHAMYFVIVRPKINLICKKKKPEYVVQYEDCFETFTKEDESKALKRVIDECKLIHPNLIPRNEKITVEENTNCSFSVTSTKQTLTYQERVFVHTSEIAFTPAISNVTIKVAGVSSPFYRKVSGKLHFDYILDPLKSLRRMRLNSMKIKLDKPINTDAGNFTDICFILLKTCNAHCKDKNPPVATPCDWYQIKKNEFQCNVYCKIDGDARVFPAVNKDTVDVYLGAGKKTFNLTGSMDAKISVDGEPTEVKIDINITGTFVNFSPKAAQGAEAVTEAECSDMTNGWPIVLDASASFDVDGTIPSSSYEWYEDYGLVTETLWGKGKMVTIGVNQIAWGVHDFVLIIRDSHGVADMDTFSVVVKDTKPPDLWLSQPNIFVLQILPASPLKLDIGKGGGSDECNDCMYYNDAPAGSIFPPCSETTVTWEAADIGGNVTKKVQKVYLYCVKSPLVFVVFMPKLVVLMRDLKEANVELKSSIESLGEERRCILDLVPHREFHHRLIEVLGMMEISEERQIGLRGKLIECLEGSVNLLREADVLLRESNAQEGERVALRFGALDRLEDVEGLYDEILSMVSEFAERE